MFDNDNMQDRLDFIVEMMMDDCQTILDTNREAGIEHDDTDDCTGVYHGNTDVQQTIANALIERSGIEVKDIFFNRAFLQVPLADPFIKDHNGVHVDIAQPHYAAVYYMNDSDGDTLLYEQNVYNTPFGSKNNVLVEHKRVSPKKGRIVLFDGARYHCSTQPRENYRCIINFVLI